MPGPGWPPHGAWPSLPLSLSKPGYRWQGLAEAESHGRRFTRQAMAGVTLNTQDMQDQAKEHDPEQRCHPPHPRTCGQQKGQKGSRRPDTADHMTNGENRLGRWTRGLSQALLCPPHARLGTPAETPSTLKLRELRRPTLAGFWLWTRGPRC